MDGEGLFVGSSGTPDFVYHSVIANFARTIIEIVSSAKSTLLALFYGAKSLTTPRIIYSVESVFDDIRSKFFVFFLFGYFQEI